MVLGEGRLINLAAAEGHPASVMDMSFANQALAADYMIKNHGSLQKQVYSVPEALDKQVAKMKLESMGVKSIGVTGKAVLVDAMLDEKFAMSVRNVAGVSLLQSNRVTARDVANSRQVVLTRAAVEKLEAALGA